MRALRWGAAISAVVVGVGLGLGHQSALAQPPGSQTDGMVQSVEGGLVTLTNGVSFPVTDATRVTRIESGSLDDLVPGKYISLSARPGPGGVLEASLVGIFAEGVTPNEGQRAMTDVRFCQPGCESGDLMTNAAIDDARLESVSEGQLTISFAGQTGIVTLTQATRVELQSPGSLADVVPGANVLGFVNDEGNAASVWVYTD